MSDPLEIWQFGQWIGRREGGAARLAWADGELILRIHQGRIRFVEGIDSTELSRRLSCQPVGKRDLLEEARMLARDGQIAETYAMGAAKELIQKSLRAWLLDANRELEIVEGEPDDVVGFAGDYAEWLSTDASIPKLFINAEPGSILVGKQREFCRTWPNQEEITVKGSHFIQEDSPDAIGEAVGNFVANVRG